MSRPWQRGEVGTIADDAPDEASDRRAPTPDMVVADAEALVGLGLDAARLATLRDGLEVAVRAAGDAIRTVAAQSHVRVGHKHGEGPVTEADYAADEVLHRELTALLPGAHWLSEESAQEAPLIHGEPTWVVDPLDGTREFLRGLPEYGVSVGLFTDDRLVLGAVYIPEDDRLLSGLLAPGRREARLDGHPLDALVAGRPVERVVVSRHDYEWREIHHRIPFEVYPCGSAAVKLAHAAEGQADVYLSTGPRSVWDVAGGVAVLRAVGGDLVQFNGRPLPLSPQQVAVPPYAAGDPSASRELLRRLGANF